MRVTNMIVRIRPKIQYFHKESNLNSLNLNFEVFPSTRATVTKKKTRTKRPVAVRVRFRPTATAAKTATRRFRVRFVDVLRSIVADVVHNKCQKRKPVNAHDTAFTSVYNRRRFPSPDAAAISLFANTFFYVYII